MKTTFYLSTIHLLLALALTSHAGLVVWDSTVNAVWSTDGNWVGGSAPVSGVDSVSFPSGMNNNIGTYATLNYDFVLADGQNMTIGAAGQVRVDSDLTLSSGSTLDFSSGGDGVISVLSTDLNANRTVTVEANATASAWRLFTGRETYDSTWIFIADSAGVTTVDVTERLYLRGNTALEVDLTNYDIANGTTLVLFDYVLLTDTGPFSSVTFSDNWVGTINYAYDQGSGDLAVALTDIQVVPEPSTLSLMGIMGLVALLFKLRRR